MAKSFEAKAKKRVKINLGPEYIQTPIRLSIFATLIILAIILISLSFIQPVVPLFYSLSEPEQQLAGKHWLLLLPALSLIFNFIHLGIIKLTKQLDQLVIKLYAWSGLVVQAILLMITLRNILIVIKIW